MSVTSLDLRPGGDLIYLMTAVASEQVAFMKQAGMPLAIECRGTYTEVSPPNRPAYKTLADFVPGVTPNEVATVVGLKATIDGLESMPDSLFALAAAYRALFTVAGGHATGRLAPDRPMRHAWILAGIGFVAGLAGAVAYYAIGGAELGSAWYPISIPRRGHSVRVARWSARSKAKRTRIRAQGGPRTMKANDTPP